MRTPFFYRLLTFAACFFCASILFYAFTAAFAEDQAKLKPLPKFLRNAKLAERYLNTRDIDAILEFERKEPVCLQLLSRDGVAEKFRLEAIHELAKIREVSPVQLLVTQVQLALENGKTNDQREILNDLALLLPKLEPTDLLTHRDQIERLTSAVDAPAVRQAAFAGLIIADKSIDPIWRRAESNEATMFDVLQGAKLVGDLSLRKKLFEKVLPIAETSKSTSTQIAAIEALPHLGGNMSVVFDSVSTLIADGKHVPECAFVLAQVPAQDWNTEKLFPLCNDLLKYLSDLSISDRAEKNGTVAVDLVQSLSEKLSTEQRMTIRSQLTRLSVQLFSIVAVAEKMAYDKTVLVIDAGRPTRIQFKNHDIMPHNLVVGDAPNARVELGLMADEMQNDKNALAKGYLPESDMLLYATKLIQPGQTDSIDFVLIEPGIYPFVCTFPGHWSKMYGAIKVVDNAQQFIASNQPLPSADGLLGIRKVEWKFEDLVTNLDAAVATGRSFENGLRWFKQASCSSCHRMKESGGLVGPDLTEISNKYKLPSEVLMHIMNPSKTVEDKFASISIIDADGLVHQGVVLKRTDEEVYLLKNAWEGCSPTVIRVEDIEDESKSLVSPMPENLLNTIVERDEVYDLLSYIISGANKLDPRFQ